MFILWEYNFPEISTENCIKTTSNALTVSWLIQIQLIQGVCLPVLTDLCINPEKHDLTFVDEKINKTADRTDTLYSIHAQVEGDVRRL